MYHQILAQLFRSLRTLLVSIIKSCTKSEPYKVTLCRVLALIMFAAPLLVHAEPLVRSAEATTQRGVAKLHSLLPKTVTTNVATAAKPVAGKSIGIDKWIAESKSATNNEVSRPTSKLAAPEKPNPFDGLRNLSSPFSIFPTLAMFQAGTSLEMGATGPAGNGPSTADQAVTLFENAVTAYTPTTTVTYHIANQQFGLGAVQGLPANSAINFGAAGNAAADTPLGGFALYSLMNGISGPTNAMFTACNSCPAGTSIDVAVDKAIAMNLITDALINAANTNLQALNARVYYGDLTISFNRPVSNPVLQFVGMGGQTSIGFNGSGANKFYDMGFSTEFDLVGSNVTLSKLVGNSVLNVTATSITNSATRIGASSAGSVVNGITRTAASGSVLATGTNITSITLKMYVRGDGGIVVNSSGVVQTPDVGWEPKWSIAAGYLPTGATTAFTGQIAGDTILFGASIQKPVTVSGTVFNDTNGLSDSIINGTGSNAGGLNAILVDSSGNVVASVAVAADGTYSLLGIGEGSYTLRLSTTAGVQGAAAPAASLPATWTNTGEGTTAAGDGTVNGSTAVTVAPGVNVTGANFGIAQPGLSLTKTNPAGFTTGSAANYTLTVSNAANRPTTGTSVVVNDKLPPNFAYNSAAAGTGATGASCTSSGTVAAGLDLVCTITTTAGIAGGGTAAFTINATPQTAAGGVAGINKAAVSPAGGTPVAPSTCTATGTPAGCALAPSITPTATPVVAGYKSVKLTTDIDSSGSITPGDTLTYTLQYANTGTIAVPAFQVNDQIPSGFIISATGGQTVAVTGAGTTATKNTLYTGAAAGAVSNLLAASATIAPGGAIIITIPVTVTAGATGTKSNQASATGSGLAAAVLTDNSGQTSELPSTVTAAPYNLTVPTGSIAQTIAATMDPTTVTISGGLPDLKLLKVAPTSAQAGSSLTYTMSVLNVGPGATTATTTVVDALPAGVTVNNGAAGAVTLSGLNAANWTCNSDAGASQTITCTSTTAIAATSGTSIFAFNVDVGASVTTDIVNQAKVFGGGDPNKPALTTTGTIAACTLTSENIAGGVANAGCAFEATPVINVAGFKSAHLTTDADSSSSVTPGDTLTYTLQYVNTGTADATVFQINDVLPTGLTKSGPLSITLFTGGSVAVSNPLYTGAAPGTVSDLLLVGGILKAGGVITLNIPVTVNAGFSGTLNNQATGTATELLAAGIRTDNAGATADLPAIVRTAPYNLTVPAGSIAQTIAATIDPTTVTVAALPLVMGYKSVKLTNDADSSGSVTQGDGLTWTISYANTGTASALNFQINDHLPTGATLTATGAQTVTVSGTGTTATKNALYAGAVAGATSDLLAAGATLGAGGVITISIPININIPFTGTLSNQSSATGLGLATSVLSDNIDSGTTGLPSGVVVPSGSFPQGQTATIDPTTIPVPSSVPPSITLVKSCPSPATCTTASQPPGTDLTYKIAFTNSGGAAAQKLIIVDAIPDNTDFKLGSETTNLGTTGLTFAVEYSNDYNAASPGTATWTYVPVSGGGSADSGYDRNVKAVRWRVTAGNLSQTPPNHTGDAGFTVKIR